MASTGVTGHYRCSEPGHGLVTRLGRRVGNGIRLRPDSLVSSAMREAANEQSDARSLRSQRLSAPHFGGQPAPKDTSDPSSGAPDASETLHRITRRAVRFRPRTRSWLVFIGAVGVVSAWWLPWYTSLAWLTSDGTQAAVQAGYQVTNLPIDDPFAHFGLGPVQREFSGATLASGPDVLRSLSFSSHDFDDWLLLAVVSLIGLWTYEQPSRSTIRVALDWCIKYIKPIALVYALIGVVWKAAAIMSLNTVDGIGRTSLSDTLAASGVAPAALQQYHTGFSTGLFALTIGLSLAFLGVFSGTKTSTGGTGDAGAPLHRVRVSAVAAGGIALAYIWVCLVVLS